MADGDRANTMSVYGTENVDLAAAYRPPAKGRTQASYYVVPGEGRVDIKSSELQLSHEPPRFDYMSWGMWYGQQVVQSNSFRQIYRIGEFIIGRQTTPDEFRALSGRATYTGPLRGSYSTFSETGILGGKFQLDADFSAQTFNGMFDFRTASGSALTRARMVGTEIYHGSSFMGDLAPMRSRDTGSGTFRGRFYGPHAEEVGGVFEYHGTSDGVSVRGLYGGTRR